MKEETETQRSYVNVSMALLQVSGGTRISNPGLSDSRTQSPNHPAMPLDSWDAEKKEVTNV